MRRLTFTTGEIYHVFSRGVEKRRIFLDDNDRFRFIHDLYEFNDEELASTLYYKQAALKSYEIGTHKISHKRKPIVEVLAFALMGNHYHLLLRQIRDGGLTEFMQKLGVGYAMHFNKKYKRVGPLFQGRFGAAHVHEESHLVHLPIYIHLNPLDLFASGWRTHKIKNINQAFQYLESYRWSSHLDYLGHKNFPSVTSRDLILEILGGKKRYIQAMTDWISDPKLGLIDNHLTAC